VAQRVGRVIAILFHDHGTRRRWVVSSTPRPLFTPGKDPVPIWQEAGWAPGHVWTGGKSRLHWDSIPGPSSRSQSLYQLSYPAHKSNKVGEGIVSNKCVSHMYICWSSDVRFNTLHHFILLTKYRKPTNLQTMSWSFHGDKIQQNKKMTVASGCSNQSTFRKQFTFPYSWF